MATIAIALILDALCGVAYSTYQHLPLWHGLYAALANAVTVGSDVAPVSTAGYVINALEFLTIVPLFAATFSLFTSGLAALHIGRSEARIKAHVTATNDDQEASNGV